MLSQAADSLDDARNALHGLRAVYRACFIACFIPPPTPEQPTPPADRLRSWRS